jgi:tetratricopeptide (TPR) repeat protein
LGSAPAYLRPAPNASLAERNKLYRQQKLSFDGQNWLIGRSYVSLETMRRYVHGTFLNVNAEDLGRKAGTGQRTDTLPALSPDLPPWWNWLSLGLWSTSSSLAWKDLEEDINLINTAMVKDLGAEAASDVSLRPPLPEAGWPAKASLAGDPMAELEDRWVALPYIGSVRHPREQIEEHMRHFGGEAEAVAMRRGDRLRNYGLTAGALAIFEVFYIFYDAMNNHYGHDYHPDWLVPAEVTGGVLLTSGWVALEWGGPMADKAQKDFNAKLQASFLASGGGRVTADAALYRGDYRAALQSLQATRRQVGDRYDLMDRMGYCYFQLKDFSSALICYKRALALSPGDETALKMLRALEATSK